MPKHHTTLLSLKFYRGEKWSRICSMNSTPGSVLHLKIRFGFSLIFFITRQKRSKLDSHLVRVEVPPGSKAVLTGVPHGMNMEPMEACLQSRHSPVDPYVCSHPSNKVGPLGGWVLSSKMSLNPYLLNVQGARYPTAGLQYNLSTCDPNQLKPTSSHWQSMAIQTMAIHVWPRQSTSSQYHQRSSKPKIMSR